MSNSDAPFGFQPFGPILRAQWYPVGTAYGYSIFHNDPIQRAAAPTGLVCKVFGSDTRESVILQATTGAAAVTLGAAMGFMDSDGDPILYLPASTTGDSVVAGYVLVADHPAQLFIAQEDGDTTPIAAANIGLNIEVILTHAGVASTGRSRQEIDSSSVANTNTFPYRLVRSYPGDTVASAYCRWVVTPNPNAHFYSSATAL
ncbi:MAG: hypothetical protein V2B18_25585 [Pseudomonadota bacterium]